MPRTLVYALLLIAVPTAGMLAFVTTQYRDRPVDTRASAVAVANADLAPEAPLPPCIGLIAVDELDWPSDAPEAAPTPQAALDHIARATIALPPADAAHETYRDERRATLAADRNGQRVFTASVQRISTGWVVTSVESCGG